MAESHRMTAAQLADKLMRQEHAEVLLESVAWMAQQLMEAEVASKIGAELGERTLERTTQRNRYRPRAWDTGVGQLELAIPKLAMRCVKRRLGPVSGHRGVAAQRVRAEPTTGQARTA